MKWYGGDIGSAEEKWTHNWMLLYAIRKNNIGEQVKDYITRCKDITWAQLRLNRISGNPYAYGKGVSHFIMVVDKIEYTLDPADKSSIRNALQIHEAFYEKEFKEGIKQENEKKEKRRRESFILTGVSSNKKRKERGEYVEYTRAQSVRKIARWIVKKQSYKYALKYIDIDTMILETPDMTKVKLNEFGLDPSDIPYTHSGGYRVEPSWQDSRTNWIEKDIEKSLKKAEKDLEQAWIRVLDNWK